MLSIILLLLLYLILILILLSFFFTYFSPISWITTREKDLSRIVSLANLQPNQILYDLGSGDGRVIFYLAQQFPRSQIIGIEKSLPLFSYSYLKKTITHSPAKLYCQNFLHHNLTDADIIFIFGIPKFIKNKVEQKIQRECQPGCKIISYVFTFPNLNLITHDQPHSTDKPIYVYQM